MSGPADPPAQRRALVVEDEASIRRGVADLLRFRGCEVELAVDGADGLRRGLASSFDVIVLDLMLPELSGFEVCERLRASGCTAPVLMLTAKDDEDDIVRGFEVGANDYVTKPFGVRELGARLDALLRRAAVALPEAFRAGPLHVRVAERMAERDDFRVALSERELRILRVLSENPGRIVSRRTLLRDAWGMNNVEQLETRTVDMHIAKLRKKLGPHGALIATVRGQGYRLC